MCSRNGRRAGNKRSAASKPSLPAVEAVISNMQHFQYAVKQLSQAHTCKMCLSLVFKGKKLR